MAQGDRQRWDVKHAPSLTTAAEEPDAFLIRALDRIGSGNERTALDLACGAGRNALELARRGWIVSAWDVSPIGLEAARKRATRDGLMIATREVDLATDEPPAPPRKAVDLLVVINYLERSLAPHYAKFVRPGGHLAFSTFTVDREGEHPALAFCLERGELARGFPGFEVLDYDEHHGRAGLLARRTAVAST